MSDDKIVYYSQPDMQMFLAMKKGTIIVEQINIIINEIYKFIHTYM